MVMAGLAMFTGACANPNQPGLTSNTQPGPVAGKAVGGAVGAVAGNVAAGAVGVGEGTVGGVSKAFDSRTTVVRRWRTEVTPDGRTVQVPEDIIVNGNER